MEKLTGVTDSIMSKVDQVFAVMQGLDVGGVIKTDGQGIICSLSYATVIFFPIFSIHEFPSLSFIRPLIHHSSFLPFLVFPTFPTLLSQAFIFFFPPYLAHNFSLNSFGFLPSYVRLIFRPYHSFPTFPIRHFF